MTEGTRLQEEYTNLTKIEEKLDEDIELWEKKSNQKYEMSLLHKYNEVKDAAQIILGAIANIEGATVKELHQRFDLPLGD